MPKGVRPLFFKRRLREAPDLEPMHDRQILTLLARLVSSRTTPTFTGADVSTSTGVLWGLRTPVAGSPADSTASDRTREDLKCEVDYIAAAPYREPPIPIPKSSSGISCFHKRGVCS